MTLLLFDHLYKFYKKNVDFSSLVQWLKNLGMFYFQVCFSYANERATTFSFIYRYVISVDIKGRCEACIFKNKTQTKSSMYSWPPVLKRTACFLFEVLIHCSAMFKYPIHLNYRNRVLRNTQANQTKVSFQWSIFMLYL